jgi:DNA-directed RNA polymerase specialized sigma24 family protein
MIDGLFLSLMRRLAALFRRFLGSDVDTDELLNELYVRMRDVNLSGVHNAEAYVFAAAFNLAKQKAKDRAMNSREAIKALLRP